MSKEIIEGNKLIAEFMGVTHYIGKRSSNQGKVIYRNTPVSPHAHYDLKFHSSWDWLMPVVEKIEEIQNELQYFTVVIEGNKCQILERKGTQKVRMNYLHHTVKWIVGKTKHDAVWQAVVEFIKWYNKQQHENKQ